MPTDDITFAVHGHHTLDEDLRHDDDLKKHI